MHWVRSGLYLVCTRFCSRNFNEKPTWRFMEWKRFFGRLKGWHLACISTRYILTCTVNKAVQIRIYQVPNWNVDFSWILNHITRRYVPLQTSTSGFVLYLSTYPCSTVTTQYVLVCTCNFKTFTSMYEYVLVLYWVILSMYLYILVRTRKNKKTNMHNVKIRTVGLKHSILRAIQLLY
jgi:hypothetical protein